MNHIYKTILDKQTGGVKVVAENASSSHKQQSTKEKKGITLVENHTRFKFLVKITLSSLMTSTLCTAIYANSYADVSLVNQNITLINPTGKTKEFRNLTGHERKLVGNKKDAKFLKQNVIASVKTSEETTSGVVSPSYIMGRYEQGYEEDTGIVIANITDAFIEIDNRQIESTSVIGAYADIQHHDYGYSSASAIGKAVLNNSNVNDVVGGKSFSSASPHTLATATGIVMLNNSTANQVVGADADVKFYYYEPYFGPTLSSAIGTVTLDKSTAEQVIGASSNISSYDFNYGFMYRPYVISAEASAIGIVTLDNSVVNHIVGASSYVEAQTYAETSVTGTVKLKNHTADHIIGASAEAYTEVYSSDHTEVYNYNGADHTDDMSTLATSTGTVTLMDSFLNNIIGAEADVKTFAKTHAYDSPYADVKASAKIHADVISAEASATGIVTLDNSAVNHVIGASSYARAQTFAEASGYAEASNYVDSFSALASATGTVKLDNSSADKILGASTETHADTHADTHVRYYANAQTYSYADTISASASAMGTAVLNNSEANQVIGAYAEAYADVSASTSISVDGEAYPYTYAYASASSNILSASASAKGIVTLNNSQVNHIIGAEAYSQANLFLDHFGSPYSFTSSAAKSITASSAATSTVKLNDSTVASVIGAQVNGYNAHLVATNSEINLYGNTHFIALDGNSTILFGGKLAPYDGDMNTYNLFTNNTLNIHSAPIKVDQLGNFENYNFYITDLNATVVNDKDKALITVNDILTNDLTLTAEGEYMQNKSTYQLAGISGKYVPTKQDFINLLTLNGQAIQGEQTTDFSSLLKGDVATHTIDVGLTQKADVSYRIDEETQTLVAYFEKDATSV